jgi:hypothetical protein
VKGSPVLWVANPGKQNELSPLIVIAINFSWGISSLTTNLKYIYSSSIYQCPLELFFLFLG